MESVDYWNPGSKIFISITSTRYRAIDSTTATRCEIATCWDEAFEVAKKFLANNYFSADSITFFVKPRLCKECMKHAVIPMIFEQVEHKEECLCLLLKTTCGVH